MNRSESKYFATAEKMDEALLMLLEKKDFAYITVKEICETAGVNRSTFYLHYETIGDLLSESIEYINKHFLEYMQSDNNTKTFLTELQSCPVEELYLVTPKYLSPYLNYIKDHQRLFRTALKNAVVLQQDVSYADLVQHVLLPILERYRVPEKERTYILTFYIHGIMGIIREWLKNDCSDSVEQIITVIQRCVISHEEKENRQKVEQ